MKKLITFLCTLCLCLGLSLALADTAYAGDLDYIHSYDVSVTPNVDDGSLRIQVDFQWEVLDKGPVEWLQIGIPNGSIRNVEALTDNIASLSYDNSFMYVYFRRGYDDGEVFNFSYAWTQEYMYTRDELSGVSYSYTPGWFNEARIGKMTVTWNSPAEASPGNFSAYAQSDIWAGYGTENGAQYVGENLGHGEQITVEVSYAIWPTQLPWEGSSENLPADDWYGDDWYNDPYYEDDGMDPFTVFVIVAVIVLILVLFLSTTTSDDGYSGGFGTQYVLWHGLWYPADHNGRPRPNSVGTKHKPSPPRSSGSGGSGGSRSGSNRSSGFGGGSRGGGFGGGGFGGGGHCACASSCACACACACAGGGRAGCSAKNLYGSVRLSRELTEQLTEE